MIKKFISSYYLFIYLFSHLKKKKESQNFHIFIVIPTITQ